LWGSNPVTITGTNHNMSVINFYVNATSQYVQGNTNISLPVTFTAAGSAGYWHQLTLTRVPNPAAGGVPVLLDAKEKNTNNKISDLENRLENISKLLDSYSSNDDRLKWAKEASDDSKDSLQIVLDRKKWEDRHQPDACDNNNDSDDSIITVVKKRKAASIK